MDIGKYKIFLIGLSGLFAVSTSAEPLRELAINFALKAKQTPTLDGKLDEACWKQVPEFTRYRVRTKKLPKGKHAQKTSLKILWDNRGIYFGVTNYEKNLEILKANARTRNDGYVWADDSSEFYLDPTCTGYTHFKFNVNSIGTIADFWQVDMGFTDTNWSASSAKAVCGKTADAWVMEFFISWHDLKKTPQVGNIWMLIHRRLEYTSGKLIDYSTSGGAHNDWKFGYIYFIDQTVPSPEKLGAKLLKIASPDWVLPINGKWLWAKDKKVDVTTEQAIQTSLRQQAETALKKAAGVLKSFPSKQLTAKLNQLQKQFDEANQKNGFAIMADFSEITTEAEKMDKEAQLMELMNE